MFSKILKTNRNFSFMNFKDDYDVNCNIQISSANKRHIWLGTEKPNPRILSCKLTPGTTGWCEYPLPNDVLIDHRMHLTQRQSFRLALRLIKFAILGKL